MVEKAMYGAINPNATQNPNADHGWGGYQWPLGVPDRLLATVSVPGGVRITVRKELAELVELNYKIALIKYGRMFTRGWTGGYENRPIGGTAIASNHSRAKAIDNDAQDNPQSRQFVCNIPPGLVADWESTGWYWGGRYSGGVKYDPMHFEYVYSPADVPGHVAKARQILHDAQTPITEAPAPVTPAPLPTNEEDEDMTPDQFTQMMAVLVETRELTRVAAAAGDRTAFTTTEIKTQIAEEIAKLGGILEAANLTRDAAQTLAASA